ncbi:MAG: hypothetical protein CMH28_00405 [Micavibrio sp.]|nr:hypothetical protein [Micavibrio sp.]
MEQLIESFQTYYGLDWAVLGLGLYANMLIANKKKIGFLINIIACMCGFSVAVISGQFGFVVFNCIMIAIMGKGFLNWNAEKTSTSQARQTDNRGVIAEI